MLFCLGSDSITRNASYLINIVRYNMDPYETRAVLETESNDSSSRPLAFFISRVHFDIFGKFFPLELPDISTAVSFVAKIYRSVGIAANSTLLLTLTADLINLDASENKTVPSLSANESWPGLFKQESATLQR